MEETNVNAQVKTSQEPQTQLDTAEVKPAEASNDATQNTVLNESQPEGSVSDVTPSDDKLVQPTTENVVETKPDISDDISEKLRRLEEYEVRDKELQDLKTKLGSKAQEEDNSRRRCLSGADRCGDSICLNNGSCNRRLTGGNPQSKGRAGKVHDQPGDHR